MENKNEHNIYRMAMRSNIYERNFEEIDNLQHELHQLQRVQESIMKSKGLNVKKKTNDYWKIIRKNV